MKARAWPSLAALAAAAMVVIHGWSGDSPALWMDTLNDEYEVLKCVIEHACTLVGQAASIKGVFVGGGWLAVRALFFRLGLDLDGVHLLLQGLDALGVAVVALAGIRLGGRALGAAAAFVLVYELGEAAANRQAVYNTAPLAFLGAVFLLSCIAAVERPGFLPTVVTALLAAVMADFHVACASAGVTVVWVALLAPGRRVLRAAAAATVFAAAAFAITPLAWVENVRFLLHGVAGAGAAAPHALVSPGAVALAVFRDPIARYSALGVGAWLVWALQRRGSLRRALDVPVAMVAPLLAAFVVALRHGVDDSGGKYLAHAKPAAALALGVLVVALVSWVAAHALSLRWRAHSLRTLGVAAPRAARFAPWAAAIALLVTTRSGLRRETGRLPLFTMRDMSAIAHVLRDERGWSRARLLHHLKAIGQSTVVMALLDEARGPWPDPSRPEPPGGKGDDDVTDAIALKLDVEELPVPLPPSWTVARRASSGVAVLVFTPSWIDWRRSELCGAMHGERRCFHDGEPTGPGVDPGRMVLRVPLRTPPAAPTAPSHLFMPRVDELCGGLVVAVPGPASHLDPDGRHAVLTGGDAGSLEIAWDLFTPACPDYLSYLQPHFFVEAAAGDAAALEAVLRRRER